MKYFTKQNRSFLIAFLTTIIRYYDYALFGLSASILAKNFLPIGEEKQQILGFFAIFSAAVIARPVGSLIFGFIGDKYGRVISVKISVIFATISTILIGITPGFSQIGSYATLILLLCRMTFLMSLAGEIDAIKIYVAEKINTAYKNLANGIISACSQLGALLAAIAYHFANSSEFVQYFWRINFILGGIFGLLIIFMRSYFEESREFLKYKISHEKKVVQPNKQQTISFVVATLTNGSIGGVYHFLVIFLGVFLSRVVSVIDYQQAQIMNIVLIMVYGLGALLSGFLADKIKPKRQIIYALFLSIAAVIILLISGTFSVSYIAIFLIFLAAFYTVPLQIILQSLFTTGNRMKMYSLSHSIGSIIFSSTTPFFCMLLWQYFESFSIIFCYFISLLVILLMTASYLCKKVFL